MQRTTELLEHVGVPSPVQKGRVDRLVALEWKLQKHVVADDLSIEQRIELEKLIARYERELGLQPAAEKPLDALELARVKYGPAASDDTARRAFAELLKVQQEREAEEASPP